MLIDVQDFAKQQNFHNEIQIHKLQDTVTQSGELTLITHFDYSFEDSPNLFISEQMMKVKELFNKYEFENEVITNLIEALLLEAIKQEKYNVKITSTGDNQIVLFTESEEDNFRNLAIDEDGDISYMFFAKDKSQSERKMYYFEDGINTEEIVALL